MIFKSFILFLFYTNVNCHFFYDLTIVIAPSFWEKFNEKIKIQNYFSLIIKDVNEIMSPVNIQFNIKNILIFEKTCDYINVHQNSTLMIEEFEKFILNINVYIKSDHYSLFTFDGLSSLGIANLGRMCHTDGTSVISVQHEQKHVSKIFAHELSHSLGVKHDYINKDSGCNEIDSICIMFPYYLQEYQPDKFSERSHHYLKRWKTKSNCHKLHKNEAPVKYFSASSLIQKYNFMKTKCIKIERKILNNNLKTKNHFLKYNYIYVD